MKLFSHTKKRTIFICQVTEAAIKVMKCLATEGSKREFIGLEVEPFLPNMDDKKLAEKIGQMFKKLGFNNDQVIVSLPRANATCRHLKVPAQIPQEIEKIVALQAPRLFPYPAAELNSGFQIIQIDKDGYSDVNLGIVHRQVIERYLKIFKELRTGKITVVLSSYGISQFYNHLYPNDPAVAMLIDIDGNQMELVIAQNKKMLFSRAVKINKTTPHWESLMVEEIIRTEDVYPKESVLKDRPVKIFLFSSEKNQPAVISAIKEKTKYEVEEIIFSDMINLPAPILNRISSSDSSFFSLAGLAMADIPDYLNLLPAELKQSAQGVYLRKERLNLVFSVVAIAIIFGLGFNRNLANKAEYLKRLKHELSKISEESKPLEIIEGRLKLLQGYSKQGVSALDLLYHLHKTVPQDISLTNFEDNEDKEVILRGQSQELNSVFEFVSGLQKAEVFRDFDVKVRYATKKKTKAAEFVDFEIACLKR